MAALVAATAGEEEGLGFPDMMSGLNAVPRIGRRSLPFDMGTSGFRFARGRRFGWPSFQQFRFHGNSGSPGGGGGVDSRHKREEEDAAGAEVVTTKRAPSPSPHPLPRPYATVKSEQSFSEDLVSEAARNSILQKLVKNFAQATPPYKQN